MKERPIVAGTLERVLGLQRTLAYVQRRPFAAEAGAPVCTAKHRRHGLCALARGHEQPHEAWCSEPDELLAAWTDKPKEPKSP